MSAWEPSCSRPNRSWTSERPRLDPIALPFIVGNTGIHIWGEILGGLVGTSGWGNFNVIVPYPFSYQGTIGLEGCVAWVVARASTSRPGSTARTAYSSNEASPMRVVCAVTIFLAVTPVAQAQQAMRAATSQPGPGLEVVLTWPPDTSVHRFNLYRRVAGQPAYPHDAAQFDTHCGDDRLRRHPGGHSDRF